VSVPLVVVLTIALVTVAILLVMVLALIRHVKLLAQSLKRFQEQVQPLLEEIRDGSAQATARMEGLQQRRSNGTPGARIRR
jgi:predicted PurR-regulated permease PerM